MRGKTKCHPEAHLGAPHFLGKRFAGGAKAHEDAVDEDIERTTEGR